MTPFEPVGSKSRADLLVDLAQANLDGDLIPYATLVEVLGQEDDRDGRHIVYQAVRQANKKLLRDHQRYLAVVKGQGYRVAESREHRKLARRHESKATRQINNGLAILDNTDLSDLSPLDAQRHIGATMVLRGIASAMEQQRRRTDRHEELIRKLAGAAGFKKEDVEAALETTD